MKEKILKSILLLLLPIAFQLPAQNCLPLNLPFYQPLRSLVDSKLESELYMTLRANREWARLVDEKKLSVGLVDLKDPFNIRFARINGDEMMYAASLPKIAILLAAMDALDKGEISETDDVIQDLNLMICHSSNQASTRMIDLLSYEKIKNVLIDPRYEFYDKDFGGLWVGKRYAASGRRYPDPIKGLSHAATVTQVCRFYYMLALGKLVNWERCEQMLEIMDEPALHHKFVNTIDRIAPNANVYRKSGSWRSYHSDSMLVWDENTSRRYILVALTEHPEGEQIIRELVNVAEKVLKIQE